jgi:hypothetical protein
VTRVRCLVAAACAALAVLVAMPAQAQSDDDEIRQNAFASFQAGSWRGEAALFGTDYTYGPQYQCRISAPGAELLQIRPSESSRMEAGWTLFREALARGEDWPTVDWVRVNGRRYLVSRLPWRLVQPTDNGIVLTFDRVMLGVRADERSEWLPFEYLTLEFMTAPSFEVGYHTQVDDSAPRVPGRRTISLNGFKEVASWCGRMLLRDRQDENRVRELIN